MLKHIVIAFHLLLLSFAVIPKSYLHDCHHQHGIEIDKQKAHFSDVCHVCDTFFAQVFYSSPFQFEFQTFQTPSFVEFTNLTVQIRQVSIETTSRGPPQLV